MVGQTAQNSNTLYAPKFVDDWEEQFLYSLSDWVNGMAFKDFNFTPKGKPVIKITEIKNGISNQTKFTDGHYDEIYLIKRGDMLFCWSGQPETSIDIFWWNGPEGWLNQHIFKVTPKIKNKLFFFYLLKYLKPNFVQIAVNKQTTGLGHVTKGDLERFIVKLPSSEEQRAISAVLSSLDDKIELLREQNKTLEATAQAIFKEWFVNFNFPSATGKMTDSELGEIPEGWKVDRFGNELKIEYGKSDKRLDDDGIYPVYGAGGIIGFSNSADYKDYQVIVGCRGTCGNITLAYDDSKITHNSLVISNSWPKPFIYLFLHSVNIARAITGSTQPQITIGDLGNIEIVIPPKDIVRDFSVSISSIFQKIKNNNSQIQTLSKLRDSLLPKLMSGKIRIKI